MKPVRYYCLILLIGICLPSVSLFAGNENQPAGARRLALGGAFMGVQGSFWNLWGNPAGIAGVESAEAGVFFERRFLLDQLNFGTVGFVLPFQGTHYAGLAISGLGFGGYNESNVGLNYATTLFDRLSLGAAVHYTRTSITEYGASGAVIVNAGLNARLFEGFSVGFRVFNANQAALRTEFTDLREPIPTTIDLGIAYQVSDKVLLVADMQKQVEFNPSFRGGVEYAFHKNFRARVGASNQPVTINAGFGFSGKGFDLDFSNSFHELLGYTPALSLNYRFKSGGKE
ncbi:MAG: hypothetical protein AAF998_08445 [Bacteroidota bacterium]